MPISEKTFHQVALEDPEGHWELFCGDLRQKPSMTMEHNNVADELHYSLRQQLDRDQFRVRSNIGHVRISADQYYIPDVFVVPVELQIPLRGQQILETYEEPLPLVVEIWLRSTGDHDLRVKIREYQRHGHLEIWRIHPYERTLTAWRRQSDGSYAEEFYQAGHVRPAALPGVTIDLDRLFD
jgi:Uma2 family endonuclease